MSFIKPLIDISQSNPGWDVIKAFINYYGLRDYLLFRYYERFNSAKISEIYAYGEDPELSGEEIFWREIFTGRLREDDMVKLFNFQISSWFPRKPGLYWTDEASIARKTALQNHVEGVRKGSLPVCLWHPICI